MVFISTRDRNDRVDACTAVIRGLAPGGGLYVPEEIPSAGISPEELPGLSYDELTVRILYKLLPDFGEDVLRECVRLGYADKFGVPGRVDVRYAAGKAFLELYHGPTCAFKDMALCLLPRLMTAACRIKGIKEKTVILTATSGDTGKAALEGFADVPGTAIIVFYPKDGVSRAQELQMLTQEGSNVFVCGVDGNFDDAQTGVKEAFTKLSVPGINFSSANSINIGRLAPQVSYYFYAYGRLLKDGMIKPGDRVDYSVPTGNFGDILAGWLAKRMGLPVGRLLCASNKNRVLTDFISTGVYDRRRDFYVTSSPSMDILVSSNLERLLFYSCGMDDSRTASLMKELKENGFFRADDKMMDYIRADFDCAFADDERALSEIASVYGESGYLMDTHTAVAYACAKDVYGDAPAVVLSTADPYKFSPAILKALEPGAAEDGLDAMDRLAELTGIPVPRGLSGLRNRRILHDTVIKPSEMTDYIERTAYAER